LDPTLHRTWARRGHQPRVVTLGLRKTAHVFGAIAIHDAGFTFAFTEVFNGHTFGEFLKLVVRHYRGRKVFLIIDNGPCHNLDNDGRAWLAANRHRVELCRLPAYSPELNGIEGVWKTTRRAATHNRFFESPAKRDAALLATFFRFQRQPDLVQGHVARFR
jgi:transposase